MRAVASLTQQINKQDTSTANTKAFNNFQMSSCKIALRWLDFIAAL